MPLPLSRWKLNNHFSTMQRFSVCEVLITNRSSTVRGVMFTFKVTSVIACIQFRLFVKENLTTDTNFALTGRQWSFQSILAKTAWFYCKRLQNDGALTFVHFFGPLCTLTWPTWWITHIILHNVWTNCRCFFLWGLRSLHESSFPYICY